MVEFGPGDSTDLEDEDDGRQTDGEEHGGDWGPHIPDSQIDILEEP